MPEKSKYIGIISAMLEEIQAILGVLEVERKIVKGMRTYYQGRLFGKKVILVFSRWGKVASATTATQMINDYELEELIFTGVAGGVQPHIKVGDIVIGNKLYQHDMDASPLVRVHEVPLLGVRGFKTDHSRQKKLLKASAHFLRQHKSVLTEEQLQRFMIVSPEIHLGDIASGDQFISSPAQVAKILSSLPSVMCVEMEGAAVAQVCLEYHIPFSIIRTISDNANDNAHSDFPKFAREIASTYALGVLEHYFN